jgi:hypothetical protein
MTFDPEVDQPLLPMFRSLRALTDYLDGIGHQIEVPRPQGANEAEYASCNVCGGGLTIAVCRDCRAPRLEAHIRPELLLPCDPPVPIKFTIPEPGASASAPPGEGGT